MNGAGGEAGEENAKDREPEPEPKEKAMAKASQRLKKSDSEHEQAGTERAGKAKAKATSMKRPSMKRPAAAPVDLKEDEPNPEELPEDVPEGVEDPDAELPLMKRPAGPKPDRARNQVVRTESHDGWNVHWFERGSGANKGGSYAKYVSPHGDVFWSLTKAKDNGFRPT